MRKLLKEDELATFKTAAWKESCSLENETILEPNEWQEYQRKLSPSSVDLPDEAQNGYTSNRIPNAMQNGINSS